MKKVEQMMGLLMGVSLSFILTLTGTVGSGAFTVQSFLSGFLISFIISMVITKIIPIQKISSSLSTKLNLKKGGLASRLFETLVSDLLMSPLMTFIMVFMAYKQATAHGARIALGLMLIRSEIISFVIAYIAIFFLTPVFLKYALKKAGKKPQ